MYLWALTVSYDSGCNSYNSFDFEWCRLQFLQNLNNALADLRDCNKNNQTNVWVLNINFSSPEL